MMDLLFLLCGILTISWTDGQDKTFLITAPKVLRVDALETVVVQLFDHVYETKVTLYLKDTLAPNAIIYNKETVTLNQANKFQQSASLRIFPDIKEGVTEVYLQAISGSFKEHVQIPVTRQNGYIFIQTDKPLYTPEQNVEVRVYTLNQELKKTGPRPVFLNFKDPDGIDVGNIEINDISGVKPLSPPFKIPIKPKLGIWKITATFGNFTTTSSTEFEVKEYVLPSISIRIQPEENYVSIANINSFKINLVAKYFHGEPVNSADVFLRFGYMSKGDVVMIPSSFKGYKMYSGKLDVALNIQRALSTMPSGPQNIWQMNNHFLVVVVLLQESTGGISQEAVLSNIKFVNAPYTLSSIATPPFIKPSLPYYMKILVRDPMGEPVKQVPVKVSVVITNKNNEKSMVEFDSEEERKKISLNDGVAYFSYNIPKDTISADFTFETADEKYLPQMQAQLKFNTQAYVSKNHRYIYISLPFDTSSFEVDSYANIVIHFNYRNYLPLRTFSYQVISKGKTILYDTVNRIGENTEQTINFKVTGEMVPSARLVVYYIVFGEQQAELVADSIWFNVKAKCVNNIDINLGYTNKKYRPKEKISLSVKTKSTNEKPVVAMSAVDTAVYALRDNSKSPLNKMLRHFEQSDLGCGGGGGINNADVFSRVGLTLITNADAKAYNTEEKCLAELRPKRFVPSSKEYFEEKDKTSTTVSRKKRSGFDFDDKMKVYSQKFQSFNTCCLAGGESNPTLETCAVRAARLNKELGDRCILAFRACCQYAQKLRKESNTDQIVLGRTEVESFLNVKPEQIRSYFPESWLWNEFEIDRSGMHSIEKTLPDSLTTWEIKAIGVFNNGICMADPLQVSMFEEVSLDVPLPYSMARGEQIELKGSVYNYRNSETTYSVTLSASAGVCVFQGTLLSASGQPHVNKGKIRGGSVALVRFFIMALEVGDHELSFRLETRRADDEVTVIRRIKVVPEGVKKEKKVGYKLDPNGVFGPPVFRAEFMNSIPPKLVPKSTIERQLTINGEVFGELLSIITDPKGISHLTNLPRGSGELEIIAILPIFYVYDYTAQSEQWGKLGDAKTSVLLKRKMEEGLISIMSFKSKREFSFGLWKDKEPSTWLTALVVKTLSLVSRYVKVDENMLSNTVRWLITECQNSDGSFNEKSSYKPVKIMGAGADVIEKSVYLTSFVMIGIKHALSVPSSNLEIYAKALDRASGYVNSKLSNLESCYVRAIAAYALALTDRSNNLAVRLYDKLQKESQVKGNPVTDRFWEEKDAPKDPLMPNKASAKTVETTAYMLLNCLLRGDSTYAKPIINWLTNDQRYGGGFYSTQDSILTLEALSKYSILGRKTQLDMDVDVSYRKKGDITVVKLTQRNPIGAPITIPLADDVILKTGNNPGVSFAKLRTVYYEMTENNDNCHFDLSIDFHPREDNSNDPMTLSPRIVACAKYKPRENEVELEAAHSVMEIYLPTGVAPIETDLIRFKDGLESRVSDYKIMPDKVTLQMDSIPSDDFYCVGFRVQEVFTVGMASSSPFNVYEFHNPNNYCTTLYSSQKRRLLKLCNENACQCMAAECCNFKTSTTPSITYQQRIQDVCKHGSQYVLKVKITATKGEGDFVTYTGTVVSIIERGSTTIEMSTVVSIVKKATCESTNLEIGKQYLISGVDIMQSRVSRRYVYTFPLDSKAWVEWWPSDSECQTEDCNKYLDVLYDFETEYPNIGCRDSK